MQTLMLKNETLKNEIAELERKIEVIQNAEQAPAVAAPKKSTFGTLMKKPTLTMSLFDGEAKEKRSAKANEAIKQIHQLLLDNKFEAAQDIINDKKKILFPKLKKGTTAKPLDLLDDFGETVLMKAVKAGKLDTVEELLELGASIDLPDADGETPLMTAAKYGQLSMVKALVARANRDAKTKYSKKTALHFASQYGHLEVVKALLQNGCDATVEDVDGNTAIKLAKTKDIYKAINGTLKKLEGAVENTDDEDNEELAMITGKDEYDPFSRIKKERTYSQDEDMKPLLAENETLEATKQQLMLRYEDLKAKRMPKDNFDKLKSLDAAGRRKVLGLENTPTDQLLSRYLDLVLQGNKPGALEDVERMLTEKKKKFKINKDGTDEFGETALMKASRLGYDEMVDLLLLYKCQVDLKDQDGYTAVMKAAQFGKYECLQKLIGEGADLNLSTRTGKLTALMLAAQRGHAKICRLLIAEGANHAFVDSSGKRAVDLALHPETKAAIEEAMLEHPLMEHNVQI